MLWDKAQAYPCSRCGIEIRWRPGRRLWTHQAKPTDNHFPALPEQLTARLCSCGRGKAAWFLWCLTCQHRMDRGEWAQTPAEKVGSETEQDRIDRLLQQRHPDTEQDRIDRLLQQRHPDTEQVRVLKHPPHPPGEECGSCWVGHHGPVSDCQVCDDTWLRLMGLRTKPKDELMEGLV